MPKPAFYAVHVGEVPGVYTTWSECSKHINGFSGAVYKKFSTRAQAEQFALHGYKEDKSNDKSLPTPSSHNFENTAVAGGSNDLIVYTDGACTNNGSEKAKGGIGIFFGHGDPRNISSPIPRALGRPTNQVAELYAIYILLDMCYNNPELRGKRILVYTDSEYSINCVTVWYNGWKRNGWKNSKGEPVKNLTLIQGIHELLGILKVEFHHVRGHSGFEGNEMSDSLASSGASLYDLQT